MNNRSLSPSQKTLFFPSYISELSICHIAHILFLFFPPISLQLFSSGLFHFSVFPYASCSESAVSLIAEWCAGSHIWHPLAGKSPAQPPPPSPTLFFNGADWIEIFRWPSFVPPEKTKLMQDQNNEGRSVFHLIWAGVPHGPAHGPLSTKLHHSIYQLSINQQ